jgi:hypothetical protein
MHAEKCPVCNGHGRVYRPTGTPDQSREVVGCHGCHQRGWVPVMDAVEAAAIAAATPPKPSPKQHVYLSAGLAKRLLEDGQQYRGRSTEDGYELTEIWIGSLCIVDPDLAKAN